MDRSDGWNAEELLNPKRKRTNSDGIRFLMSKFTKSCPWDDRMPSRNGDELIILILEPCVRPDEIGIGWPKSKDFLVNDCDWFEEKKITFR